MADVLTIHIDHAQPRNLRDALSFVTTGGSNENRITDRPTNGYSTYHRSQTSSEDDTWVDPITNTLMLMPLPLLSAWQSTSSGDFARLGTADLTLITSANWLEHNANGLASKFIHGKSATVQEAIRTTATQAANRALYITAKVSTAEGEDRPLMDVGWDYTNRDTPTDTVAARPVYIAVNTSGRVQVFFNGELSGEGSLSAPGQQTNQTLNDQWLKLLLIPMGTGILIYSTNGGGFFWERPDVEPDDEDPIITPASDFWWYSYGAATVEAAPLRFRTSGYRCSLAAKWTEPPQVGAVEDHRYYGVNTDDITATFVELEDATTAFVPDGIVKECRVKFALTGSGTSTPFLWAAQSAYENALADTDDSEQKDITPYIHRASFDVPESTGSPTFDFTVKRLQDMDDDLGVTPYFETMTNRPVLAKIGDVNLFDMMIAERPKVQRSTVRNADEMNVRCEGLFRLLRRFRFKDPVPLDGYSVSAVLEYLAIRSGIPIERLEIEDFGVDIGQFTRPSKGEFHACIKVGDTAAEWWDRIFSEYLSDCHWTEKPTADGVKIVAFSPDNMPALSVPYRIFDTQEAARAHLEGLGYEGEDLEAEIPRRCFRKIDEEGFEPEANTVWVMGLDRRTWRPIVVYQRWPEGTPIPQEDLPGAIDPQLAPSLRPPEWSGDENLYGYYNEAFAAESQCEDAANRLFKRLAYGRHLAEIEIDLMVDPSTSLPLWTGNEIEVQRDRADMLEDGEPSVTTWTIVRFGGEFVREFNGTDQESPIVVRPCRYVIERQREDAETSKGLGHVTIGGSLREMAAFMDIQKKQKNFYLSPKDLAPRITATEFGS